MKYFFLNSLSLQRKFFIITFTAVIIFMVIMGIIITRRESSIMYRDIERQGRILAETLAIPVMNDLIYEKLGLVEEGGLIDNYVTEIFGSKDIDLLYIAVLDTDGRVIAHNDFNEYDKVYEDPITARSLLSDSTILQKFNDNNGGYDALDVATPLSIGKKRWGTLKFAISLERLDKEVQAVILHAIIITLVLLALSLGAIILLSRRFIRPITDLARTMERAGGDTLDVKVHTRGSDEIALLGQSFNQMIERIRRSNLKLQQTHNELLKFVGTIESSGKNVLDMKVDIEGCDEITLLCASFNSMIDRIRESNVELKKTHEKLLQSQKLASLGILASGIAHEINNPLGGMFNCVQMLMHDGKNEETRERYMNLLNDGLNRIENTVGKLLWMSRKDEKNPQVVEIKRSLGNIYAFVEYQMKMNHITYREDVQNGASIFIDPHDLHQVLMNLMINAVQSMKNGGTLSINAHKIDSEVILEMSDTGDGIDREDIHKIFDPFYTTKMPGEGTGLGLWVTYEIVKSYDGEISIESKKGEGSKFILKFKQAS
jgi:signal transduction histidine kinase